MRLLRVIVIGLIAVAIILFLVSYLRPRVPFPGKTSLPLDLQTIIPATWTVIAGQYKTCDFDGDGENEYLIIYSYDPAAVPSGLPATMPTPPVVAGRSLIGGVIYDTQVNRVSQSPGVEAPYRPAFLIPYKLLPDMYGGKGQGYLGQNAVDVYLFPGKVGNNPCQAKEIAIYGNSYDSLPTNLALFRWAGDPVGYIDTTFLGNTRIQTFGPNHVSGNTKPVVEVYTFNQLNQRSLLCSVQHYSRWYDPASKDGIPPGLEFSEITADYTIDFCYGPPKDAAYPEGVVTALLRGQNPSASTPTGESYFMPSPVVPAELAFLKDAQRTPTRILSVSAPGSLGLGPPQGTLIVWAPSGNPTPAPQIWWKSGSTVPVDTEIVLGGQPRQVRWTLVSIANEQAKADTYWRITQVELP